MTRVGSQRHKKIQYSDNGKKSRGTLPSTFPSRCYAFLSSVFPWIPLYSFSHSVRRDVEWDNSIINLVTDTALG
jgi:hypothetical protein